MRRLLLLLAAFAVAGCYGGEELNGVTGNIRYYHDDAHDVSCWTAWDKSITCLPDSEVTLP